MALKIGDPIIVHDAGLLMLAKITGRPPANKGWVYDILEDGEILVEFPIGDEDPSDHSQVAPYSISEVSLDPSGSPRRGKE